MGDLNALTFIPQSFDVAIALDFIYFADELDDLVRTVRLLLRQSGRFAAFYTDCQVDGDSFDILEAERTRFGIALANNGWQFEWIEFTEKGEAEFCLERFRAGRMRRYLYLARQSEKFEMCVS